SAAGISWNAAWEYANTGQLTLIAGTNITGTSALQIQGTSSLLLVAGTGIGASPLLTEGVTDLAAKSATGDISISNSGGSNINVTTLTNPVTSSSVVGLSTTGGNISLTNSSGNITVDAAITTSGANGVSDL